jgi:collagenase-like PrtC family protease
MKRPEYVAAVTRAYRRAIDGEPVNDDVREMLALVFNRGGFTAGLFAEEPHRLYAARPDHIGIPAGRVTEARHRDITVQSQISFNPGDDVAPADAGAKPTKILQVHQADKLQILTLHNASDFSPGEAFRLTMRAGLMQELNRTIESNHRKQPLSAEITIRPGQPAALRVTAASGARICVWGETPQPAHTRPLCDETVARQLSKTADAPFYFSEMRFDIADGLSMPVRALNELRRRGLRAVADAVANPHVKRAALAYAPISETPAKKSSEQKLLAAQAYTREQAAAVRELVDILYVPIHMDAPEQLSGGVALCAFAPLITDDGELERLKSYAKRFDAIAISSFIDLDRAKIADCGFNAANSETLALLHDMGFARATLSPELNIAQIRDLAVPDGLQTEAVAYGRHILMTTAHCPFDCDKTQCRVRRGDACLQDRKHMRFPLMRVGGDCRVAILNALPLYMADRAREINADVLRLVFTIESPAECAHIARQYRSALRGDPPERPPVPAYTRGHFNRGWGDQYEF